ncbi:MAG: hypothetical protein QOJ66_3350 [Ilumatobacteraceae bacterium]
MAESEQFGRGLEIRREVLGSDYVDANLAGTDELRQRRSGQRGRRDGPYATKSAPALGCLAPHSQVALRWPVRHLHIDYRDHAGAANVVTLGGPSPGSAE